MTRCASFFVKMRPRVSLVDAQQLQRLENEAVARITWGDEPSDVQAWLIANEMSAFDAAQLVRQCLRRRAGEMRALGLRNLLRGVPSLLGSVALGIVAWMLMEWISHQTGGISPLLYAISMTPALSLGGYGCWQTWLALDRLVFGARADGAVSDVE